MTLPGLGVVSIAAGTGQPLAVLACKRFDAILAWLQMSPRAHGRPPRLVDQLTLPRTVAGDKAKWRLVRARLLSGDWRDWIFRCFYCNWGFAARITRRAMCTVHNHRLYLCIYTWVTHADTGSLRETVLADSVHRTSRTTLRPPPGATGSNTGDNCEPTRSVCLYSTPWA